MTQHRALIRDIASLTESEGVPTSDEPEVTAPVEPVSAPGKAPDESPDEEVPPQGRIDGAVANEIRSATHAVLGRTLGTQIMNSKLADELKGMIARLAERWNVPEKDVIDVAKTTLGAWRYGMQVSTDKGGTVALQVRLDLGT